MSRTRKPSRTHVGTAGQPRERGLQPDYRHLPVIPARDVWVATTDVNPPHDGPRRFAFNDDMFLIERFIGAG